VFKKRDGTILDAATNAVCYWLDAFQPDVGRFHARDQVVSSQGFFDGSSTIHRAEVVLNAVALTDHFPCNGVGTPCITKASPAHLRARLDIAFNRLACGH